MIGVNDIVKPFNAMKERVTSDQVSLSREVVARAVWDCDKSVNVNLGDMNW